MHEVKIISSKDESILSERGNQNSCFIKTYDYNQVDAIGKFVTAYKPGRKQINELDENEMIKIQKRQLGYLKSIALTLRGPQANIMKSLPTEEEEKRDTPTLQHGNKLLLMNPANNYQVQGKPIKIGVKSEVLYTRTQRDDDLSESISISD